LWRVYIYPTGLTTGRGGYKIGSVAHYDLVRTVKQVSEPPAAQLPEVGKNKTKQTKEMGMGGWVF